MVKPLGTRGVLFFLMICVFLVLPLCIPLFQANISRGLPNSSEGSSGLTTYAVVPITVFRVAGATITPVDVEKLLKDVNDIYNCEAVVYVWNGQILDVPDPVGSPGQPGDVQFPDNAQGKDEHDKLKKSCEDHPLKPQNSGVHLVFANQIVNGSGASVAGGYVLGDENPAVVADYAAQDQTWGGKACAHEVGHVLGLNHNGNTDPNNPNGLTASGMSDGNGDGVVNDADKDYNMYGGLPPGTKLTALQHYLAYMNAMKYPGAYARPLPSSGRPPTPPNKPVQVTGRNSTPPVNQTGPVPVHTHTQIDITKFHLARNLDPLDPTLNISITVNGTILKAMNVQYGIVINMDGSPPRYNVSIESDYPILFVDLGSGTWNNLGPLLSQTTITYSNASTTGDMHPSVTYDQAQRDALVNPPGTFLENATMHVTIRGWIVNTIFGNDNDTGLFTHDVTAFATQLDGADVITDNATTYEAWLGPSIFPYILTDKDYAKRGDTITATFYNFSPNQPVNLTLNGLVVWTGTTNASGGITGSFVVPEISDDIYILFGNDAAGHYDGMYLQVAGKVETMPEEIDGFPMPILLLCVFSGIFLIGLKRLRKYRSFPEN